MGVEKTKRDERVDEGAERWKEVGRGETTTTSRRAHPGRASFFKVSVQATMMLRQAAASATLKESARGEERPEKTQGEGRGK